MSHRYNGIDLDYRPTGHFWPLTLATHLLATVKGAERRKYIQGLIDAGRLDLLDAELGRASLDRDLRAATGRIHPWLMGGEYLPDALPGEVEIARVTLASTTQDVVSVRARRGKRRIRYRVVDEYGGETLTGRRERTSVRPLSLGALVDFLDGAWPMREVVTMNDMECDVGAMRSFISVSSPFYSDLATYYDRCFVEWAAECRMERGGDDLQPTIP
jgi:hypothetical protein